MNNHHHLLLPLVSSPRPFDRHARASWWTSKQVANQINTRYLVIIKKTNYICSIKKGRKQTQRIKRAWSSVGVVLLLFLRWWRRRAGVLLLLAWLAAWACRWVVWWWCRVRVVAASEARRCHLKFINSIYFYLNKWSKQNYLPYFFSFSSLLSFWIENKWKWKSKIIRLVLFRLFCLFHKNPVRTFSHKLNSALLLV